jgi:hypothetical protein
MSTMHDENPFSELPLKATLGEIYSPAMKITANLAPFYLERLIERRMKISGVDSDEARRIELESLGYAAENYGAAAHVQKVFGAFHPFHGAARPDPATALAIGEARGHKILGHRLN